MPERPAMSPSQVEATSPPRAVTIPSPVTTTRRGPAPKPPELEPPAARGAACPRRAVAHRTSLPVRIVAAR